MDRKYIEHAKALMPLIDDNDDVSAIVIARDEDGTPKMRAVKPFGIAYHWTEVAGEVSLAQSEQDDE